MASSIFSGSSRYAADFAQVIERSVAIASLPLSQLANDRGRFSGQAAALEELARSVSSLRSAVTAIDDARSALSVSSSDGTIAGANAELTALPGTYEVSVVSTGSRTTATSSDDLPKVSNYLTQSVSTASSFTLTANGTSYTITPSAKNLAALAAAINAEESAGVQAVILNLGTASAPDYRISLQSTRLGPVTLQLTEADADPAELLTEIAKGTQASYRINGQPAAAPLTSDAAAQVQIAPGVTVDLLKPGTATIVVRRDSAKLSGFLSNFAAAYNSLVAALDENRGESDSPLNGHSIVWTIAQSLRGLTAATAVGEVTSLADLGFTFSDKGVLTFDAAKFAALDLSEALAFLDTSNTSGLLATADRMLDTIDADSAGLLSTTIESVTDQIVETDRQIAINQERIDLLRDRLAAQMSAADALIGMMEQQVSYLSGLFEAMRSNE